MLFSYFICKQLVFASEVNKEEEKETNENGINKAAAIIDAILLVIDEVAREKICPIAEETGDHLLDEGIGVLQNCMGKVVDENIGFCAGKRKEELASLFKSKIENLDFTKVIENAKVNIEANPSALNAGNEQKISNVLESLQLNKCRTKEIVGFMRERSKKSLFIRLGDTGTKVLTEKVQEDFTKTVVKDKMQSAGHNLADALVDELHNSIYDLLSRIIEEKVLPFLPDPVVADDESSFAKTRNFFVVACQYIWLKIVRVCY